MVRGLRLAVHEWGDPSAPVLLCLHGFLDTGRSFSPIAEALSGRYRVVAPDFRGHGASDWIGAGGYYHFHDYYGDMTDLIESFDFTRFSILAHSMGGTIAIVLSNLFPERVSSMILLEGMGPEGEDIRRAPDRLRRFVTALRRPALMGDVEHRRRHRRVFDSVEEAAVRMMELNQHLGRERALELAEVGTEPAPRPEGGTGVAWCFDPLHRSPSARPFNFEEFQSYIRGISAPVLALYGGESTFPFGELEIRHQMVRELRAATIPNTGHNIHHDRAQVVTAATRFWLEGDRQGALPPPLSEMKAST